MFVLCAVLYLLSGFLTGWGDAYEVLAGIDSPADADHQWVAWPLALMGWAAIPALIGGLAGYLITVQIQNHQSRELAEVLDELRGRMRPPSDPESGT